MNYDKEQPKNTSWMPVVYDEYLYKYEGEGLKCSICDESIHILLRLADEEYPDQFPHAEDCPINVMKVVIQNTIITVSSAPMLEKMSFKGLYDYAHKHGWKDGASYPSEGILVYHKDRPDGRSMMIPYDECYGKRYLTIYGLLSAFSVMEHKTNTQVYWEIMTGISETQKPNEE